MVKRRMEIISFLVCFCICLVSLQVKATVTSDAKDPIFTDKKCSSTISYSCNGNGFSELPVKLYRIADVSANYQYVLTSNFKSSNLILNGIQTVNEWNIIRSTLETYILVNKIEADFETVTSQDGKASFEEINPGLYLAIAEPVISEDTIYKFDSALVALPILNADGIWEYQVTITPKYKIIIPSESDKEIELKVLKLWKGDNDMTDRPKSIEIEIFRNGKSYKTAILSKDNNWSYSWLSKDDGSEWKVIERNIPLGYTMTIEERERSFIITNTLNRDNSDIFAPQTGDTSNIMLYVILMIMSGSMFIIIGIIGKRS